MQKRLERNNTATRQQPAHSRPRKQRTGRLLRISTRFGLRTPADCAISIGKQKSLILQNQIHRPARDINKLPWLAPDLIHDFANRLDCSKPQEKLVDAPMFCL
ncbi:hypothetical protein [Chitinimonas sp.]|uniref:hypothetical protein n=1 Tax=Chitinimonas sp. TaxID=1934313 RepID=UPI0035B0C5C7